MKQAIVFTYLCTRQKCIRHVFFCMAEMDMNLSRRVVFCTPRRSANVLELRNPKWMLFWEVLQNFHCNYFFGILMNEYSKNLNNLFSTTTVDASGWIKKKIIEKWVIVAKWYWCQINERKSCIGHVLFFKKIL